MITLTEVVQLTIELTIRAERAEAYAKELEKTLGEAQVRITALEKTLSEAQVHITALLKQCEARE